MTAKLLLYKNGKIVGRLKRDNFFYGKSTAKRWSDINPAENGAIVKLGHQKFKVGKC